MNFYCLNQNHFSSGAHSPFISFCLPDSILLIHLDDSWLCTRVRLWVVSVPDIFPLLSLFATIGPNWSISPSKLKLKTTAHFALVVTLWIHLQKMKRIQFHHLPVKRVVNESRGEFEKAIWLIETGGIDISSPILHLFSIGMNYSLNCKTKPITDEREKKTFWCRFFH